MFTSEVAYRIDSRECLKKCGNRDGLCISFCGNNGYCCRRGWVNCPPKLRRAAGYGNIHVCVRAPSKGKSFNSQFKFLLAL